LHSSPSKKLPGHAEEEKSQEMKLFIKSPTKLVNPL